MDSERRHELEENSLARFLHVTLPKIWEKHANKILVAILLISLCVLALQWRAKLQRQEEAQLREAMATARMSLASAVRQIQSPLSSPENRLDAARNVEDSVQVVLDQSKDAAERALALCTRAQLNWLMGNVDPLMISTTQPGAKSLSSDDYLVRCEQDYKQILAEHADNRVAVMQALFGLAAIEENRGQWEKAGEWYAKIESDPLARPEHVQLAAARKAELALLAQPVLTITPPAAATQPSGIAPPTAFGPLAPTTETNTATPSVDLTGINLDAPGIEMPDLSEFTGATPAAGTGAAPTTAPAGQ